MAEIILLLVCEGETDIYIFQALSSHFSSPEKMLTVISLAPQLDATSGTYPSHGFSYVLKWCVANHRTIQMLIDFRGASTLFLQMDTDIARQVNSGCIDKGYSARHCCQEKLNEKLGVSEEPNRCHYILPTQNTETWILASHEQPELDGNLAIINNYELIDDTEKRLIALGCYPSRKGKSNKAGRKLDKKPATKYKEYGKQLTGNLALARQRCAELDRLCNFLAATI